MALSLADLDDEVRSRLPLPMLQEAKGDHTVSVGIRARNEEATIGTIVASIHEHLASNGNSIVDEILVIDHRSDDDTARVARPRNGVAQLVETAGFFKFFNPRTMRGHGIDRFGHGTDRLGHGTSALYLDVLRRQAGST